MRLPDGNGIDVLRSLKQSDDPTPVVMISGHATIRDAVEATRSGAFDFLEKPLARDRVLLVVKNALERSDLQRENQRFRELVGDAPKMIGRSAAFRHVVNQATQVARSDAGVLLTGESGTGKELLAAHIHRESPFASRAVRQGQLRRDSHRADRERAVRPRERRIHRRHRHAARQVRAGRRRHDLPGRGRRPARGVAGQAAARAAGRRGAAARQRAVDPRRGPRHLGHQPRLDELIADGKFREDLFYRLSVVPIRVPALRERLQDVRDLAAYFLAEFCTRNNFRPKAIDEDVLQMLERHHWPGNVRELRNTVERMAILSPEDRITVDSIPLEIRVAAGSSRLVRPARGPRLRRARPHSSGARADRLERRRRRARARHRADEPSQADEGAWSEPRLTLHS